MQIKTTVNTTSYLLYKRLKLKRLTILSVGEDVEELECSRTASGNIKWCSHLGEQFGSFLKSYKFIYGPTIPVHLGIHPKEKEIYVHIKICT